MSLFNKRKPISVNGVKGSRLSELQLKALRRCRIVLIKDIDPVDVVDCLISADGFKPDVKEAILGMRTREQRVAAILDRLEKVGAKTFDAFMEALCENYRQLHSVLEETMKSMDELDDDQTRERSAIMGDSVRRLLYNTSAHRKRTQRTERGSDVAENSDSANDQRGRTNDVKSAVDYVDCYVLPTRGKLQKEKWIKHKGVAIARRPVDDEEPDGKQAGGTSEVVTVQRLTFKRISRADIPALVRQPPVTCSVIYIVKTEENKTAKSEEPGKHPDPDRSGSLDPDRSGSFDPDRSGSLNPDRSGSFDPPAPTPPPLPHTFLAKPPMMTPIPKDNARSERPPVKPPQEAGADKISSLYSRAAPPPLPPKPVNLQTLSKNSAADDNPRRRADGGADDKIPAVDDPPPQRTTAFSNVDYMESVVAPAIIQPPPKSASTASTPAASSKTIRTVDKNENTIERPIGNSPDDDRCATSDDESEDDVTSLNYDVGFDDEDEDTYEPINNKENRSDKFPQKTTETARSVMKPVQNRLDTFQTPPPSMNNGVQGVDRLLNDSETSPDCSHYEEIEGLRERINNFKMDESCDIYLEARSNFNNTDVTREYKQSQSICNFKNLGALQMDDEKSLPVQSLLIVDEEEICLQGISEESEGIVDPLLMFRCTRLGYDYQGSAYYVPSNALVRYGDPQGKPWFYPIKMTAREATLFLGSANQKGSFVVFRPSNHVQVGVSYILSVCTGEGNVLHYNIVENMQGDIMIEGHDHSFMNICELVEYFQKNQSNLATRLRRPLREVNYLTATHCSYDSKYEINRQQIKLSDIEIGKGLFGDWYLAKFKEMSVSVKIMSTPVNKVQMTRSSVDDDDFLEEAISLTRTNHENIIRLMGVSCVERPFYIVTEHFKKGTLKDCLRNETIPSDNIDALFDICIQMVSAMHYLEDLHYMLHRNLAAKNFYVTSDMLIKLANFDRSRFVMDDNYQASSSEEVIVRWAAPEVLSNSTYSTKSDVWSLGIVFWEVFSKGSRPYSSIPIEHVGTYVVDGGRLEKPPGCALDLWSMMKICWREKPTDRPSFTLLHDKIKGKSSIYYVSPVRNHADSSGKFKL